MKSLSYIIILVSLIGTCQSGKAFCDQNEVEFLASKIDKNSSKDEVKQLLQELNYLSSKYNKKFSHIICSNDEVSKLKFDFSFGFNKVKSVENQHDLIKRISKIRNKDDLTEKVFV